MSVAIAQTSIYQQRIDELKRIKVEYTNTKIERMGRTMGIDDYGSVPWPDPIPFEITPNHPSGGCYGPVAMGDNFRAWLEAHPVIIHAASSLCGGWVSAAPGIGGWKPEDYDVEDFAAALVRFDNGATLMLEVSWFLHHDSDGEDMQMWLYGTKGGSHWPKCEIYETNYAAKQLYNRSLKLTGNLLEPHAQECVEFADAVAKGNPSPVPAEESLQVMTILDGIYRSQETGREVALS